MLLRYDPAFVILTSTLCATFLHYYGITTIFKMKNSNIIWITTGLFFIVFGLIDTLTHLIPYKSTEIYCNIVRNVWYIVPHIGLILLINKIFQKIYQFITKRNK